MRVLGTLLAGIAAIVLGACTTINNPAPASRSAPAAAPAGSAQPAPAITRTVTKRPGHRASVTPQPTQAPQPASAPPSTVPNVTDPWAVVSGYYGDIESGNYREAWVLLSSGMVTGQTYQQFVSGFSCTGTQRLTDLGESGNSVSFNLAATDVCTGRVQHFSGTDTVENGKIVAANVTRTG
jgi:hypothetical protein